MASMAFSGQQHPRSRPPPTPAQFQKMLDENAQLIKTITDFQSQGKAFECYQYQQTLHRNLMFLASFADTSQNMNQLLPPPQVPSQQNHTGEMNQSGPPQGPAPSHPPPATYGSQPSYRPAGPANIPNTNAAGFRMPYTQGAHPQGGYGSQAFPQANHNRPKSEMPQYGVSGYQPQPGAPPCGYSTPGPPAPPPPTTTAKGYGASSQPPSGYPSYSPASTQPNPVSSSESIPAQPYSGGPPYSTVTTTQPFPTNVSSHSSPPAASVSQPLTSSTVSVASSPISPATSPATSNAIPLSQPSYSQPLQSKPSISAPAQPTILINQQHSPQPMMQNSPQSHIPQQQPQQPPQQQQQQQHQHTQPPQPHQTIISHSPQLPPGPQQQQPQVAPPPQSSQASMPPQAAVSPSPSGGSSSAPTPPTSQSYPGTPPPSSNTPPTCQPPPANPPPLTQPTTVAYQQAPTYSSPSPAYHHQYPPTQYSPASQGGYPPPHGQYQGQPFQPYGSYPQNTSHPAYGAPISSIPNAQPTYQPHPGAPYPQSYPPPPPSTAQYAQYRPPPGQSAPAHQYQGYEQSRYPGYQGPPPPSAPPGSM